MAALGLPRGERIRYAGAEGEPALSTGWLPIVSHQCAALDEALSGAAGVLKVGDLGSLVMDVLFIL